MPEQGPRLLLGGPRGGGGGNGAGTGEAALSSSLG